MKKGFPWMQKREIIIKKKANPELGTEPDKRSTKELLNYGIVNIDKPSGPTSHQVSAYVKDILKIKKSGHSGTLDPKVTGVLPVALGRGTRIVQSLLTAGKEYICLMHLHKPTEKPKLMKTLNTFTGVIDQTPPVRSAVKRRKRQRKIYYLDVIEIKEQDVLFRVGCQAGTYIRKLVSDIGSSLGTGAHMAELRRTMAGPFSEQSLCKLQDLKDAYHYYKNDGNEKELRKLIMPIESGVQHLPKVWVLDNTVESLCHGASLKIPGISRLHAGMLKGDKAAVMTLKNELISIGSVQATSEQAVISSKGIFLKPDQVFMQPGSYEKD